MSYITGDLFPYNRKPCQAPDHRATHHFLAHIKTALEAVGFGALLGLILTIGTIAQAVWP